MASTSETGHAVNIANFKVLIERCNEFGALYNPTNMDLSIAGMTTKLDNALSLQHDYIIAMQETKLPINDREILYLELGKIVTRSYNLYFSTKASGESKRDAWGFMMKITGRNAKVPKLGDGVTPDPKHISKSQQGYAQKADNFDKLVNLYKTDANYAPNEDRLKIAALETLLDDIRTANTKVEAVVANSMLKRIARDHALYDMESGIIDLALACKKYVIGLYGGLSPEAGSVTGIKFRRVMKLNPI